MKHMNHYKDVLYPLLLGIAIVLVVFIAPVLFSGDRRIGVLETIHGIPFAVDNATTHIEEDLAHADIFLKEPLIAKKLMLTISFDPKKTQSIEVGVREGGFWLGYAKKVVYQQGKDKLGFQAKEIQFPLTTMFQDKDRSIDVMFFSKSQTPISWDIHAIRAETKLTDPSFPDVKEYIKSILKRERAL